MILKYWKTFIKNQYNYYFDEDKKLREYYNTKYPTSCITYKRTDKLGTIKIDVRQFLNIHNFSYPTIKSESDDDIALNALVWVIKNIKYVPDSNKYKQSEYWAFPYETLNYKVGDCEDGALLLYCIMRKNGIPAWKIRVSAGWVVNNGKDEGHAYVTYYCEASEKWIILDWCYWPNVSPIKDRLEYKLEEKYKAVWFSFNEEYSWSKGLNSEAKHLLNENK